MTNGVGKPAGLGISRTRIGIKLVLKHLLAPLGLVFRSQMGLRVLFYHRVNAHPFARLGLVSRELTVPTHRFARQMAYLANHGYRTIKLDEAQQMIAGDLPIDPKAVLLTFDDGYLDNLEYAVPIMARHGITAVVFPVSNLIGKDNRVWPMSDPEELGRFMNHDQLTAWLEAGHEIGSHTCTHPVLTGLDDDALRDELVQSRQALTAAFNRPCTTIAYPGGDVDGRVAAATHAAGYQMGFTTRSGRNAPNTPMMQLCRTEVSVSDTNLIFALKMHGFFDWLGVRDTVAYRKLLRFSHRVLSKAARIPRTQQP